MTKIGKENPNWKHGHKTKKEGTSPTYQSWINMLTRCTNPNPNTPYYKYYYARGITVCDRWFNFMNFLEDMGERPKRTTLDRIDNDKGYEPNNCRWATRKVQARDRNVYVLYKNERRTVDDVATELGLKGPTIRKRIRDGWPIEFLFDDPSRGKLNIITYEFQGKQVTEKQAAKQLGISRWKLQDLRRNNQQLPNGLKLIGVLPQKRKA